MSVTAFILPSFFKRCLNGSKIPGWQLFYFSNLSGFHCYCWESSVSLSAMTLEVSCFSLGTFKGFLCYLVFGRFIVLYLSLGFFLIILFRLGMRELMPCISSGKLWAIVSSNIIYLPVHYFLLKSLLCVS